MKFDGSGWDWDTFFKHLTKDQRRRCRALVVTHMFGFNQNYDEMARWCHDNDVIIFEDAIQGYTIFQNPGHELAHMTVFSGGMDKIPCTTKGGFGIVKHNVPQLSNAVQGIIKAFPSPSESQRLKDLLSNVAYWFLQGTKFGAFMVTAFGMLYKRFQHLHVVGQYARSNFLKAYTGKFTVDRISWCPSIYHLKSMLVGIRRTNRYWVDLLIDGRAQFKQILGEKSCNIVFPWKNGGDWLKEDSNLYFHALFREREKACQYLSDCGWLLLHQQAWDYVAQHPEHPQPEYAIYLKHNMVYFPVTHQMLQCEMEALAQATQVHLDKYHADGIPARPGDVGDETKKQI